jgi:type VI secretion system protein ImpE
VLAEQSLREGNLDQALAQLQDAVRKEPSNARYRIFLFQLLSLLGQWERAQKQLEVVGELDKLAMPMVQTYRHALRCEAERAAVFAGKAAPTTLGEPSRWIALLVEALRVAGQGGHAQAETLRAEALEAANARGGTIDGQPFAWIADADSRLGPVVEAVMNGRYYWIPFESIARMKFEPVRDLRDLVWTPVELMLQNGGEMVALIPTRYPGTEAVADGQLRMARKTEWLEQPGGGASTGHEPALRGGSCVGCGQRLLATDQGEHALLEVRSIEMEGAPQVTGDA